MEKTARRLKDRVLIMWFGPLFVGGDCLLIVRGSKQLSSLRYYIFSLYSFDHGLDQFPDLIQPPGVSAS